MAPLTPAELDRMAAEHRRQRARRDDAELRARGIVEARKYNPRQPRDPGGEDGGQWVKAITGKPRGGKPRIGELLAPANDLERRDDLKTLAAGVYDGEFGGLRTTVAKAYGGGKGKPDWLTVEGTIHDPSGRKVGAFERKLDRDSQGRRYVRHESLEIDPDVRGQGFAEAFNAEAEHWYRDNGVEYIELHANIDVGGYAWARSGYTWADEESRDEVVDRLADTADDYLYRSYAVSNPDERADLLRQAEQARALVQRFRSAETPDDIPTPFEVSQVGRPQGAVGKDAKWVGKDALIGSDWEGVKWL